MDAGRLWFRCSRGDQGFFARANLRRDQNRGSGPGTLFDRFVTVGKNLCAFGTDCFVFPLLGEGSQGVHPPIELRHLRLRQKNASRSRLIDPRIHFASQLNQVPARSCDSLVARRDQHVATAGLSRRDHVHRRARFGVVALVPDEYCGGHDSDGQPDSQRFPQGFRAGRTSEHRGLRQWHSNQCGGRVRPRDFRFRDARLRAVSNRLDRADLRSNTVIACGPSSEGLG